MTDQEKDQLILQLTAGLKLAFQYLPIDPRGFPHTTPLAQGCERILADAEAHSVKMSHEGAKGIVLKAAMRP